MNSIFFMEATVERAMCISPFFEEKKEQAEVGRSPTLLALRFATGVLRILRGYFRVFLPMREKKTGYFVVFGIAEYQKTKKKLKWKILMSNQ